MKLADQLASELLRIGAVRLRPEELYTWASGVKSPIYTDNRLALAYPEVRTLICRGLADSVAHYPRAEAIVGVATAGIPHAALVADRLGLPLAYVRGSAKAHGRQNRIEGKVDPGQRVVVVEDLISTGGSSLEAVRALRDAGAEVLATLAIFSYSFESAAERFAEADCRLETLTDYPTLIAVARDQNKVAADQLDMLAAWRETTSAQLGTPT